MTRYMRNWEDISLVQLLVGCTGHPENAGNGWNYDDIYKIQGEHLIDLTACRMHRAWQERL